MKAGQTTLVITLLAVGAWLLPAAGAENINRLQMEKPKEKPSYELNIKFRDGKDLQCYSLKPLEFDGTTASGQTISKVKLDNVRIDWEAQSQVFVLRTKGWTGELVTLWSAAGRPVLQKSATQSEAISDAIQSLTIKKI